MIPALAILVALACAGASARRLWLAANATFLHPDALLGALRGDIRGEGIEALREVVAKEPRADWEHELIAALEAPSPEGRAALVNEQLGELDYRVHRWARVPRVCASIAASAGLLLAMVVMRSGLAQADVSGDSGALVIRGLVGDALTVAAFGLVGTAFCVAAMAQARRLVRERLVATDRLVDLLERLGPRAGPLGPPAGWSDPLAGRPDELQIR